MLLFIAAGTLTVANSFAQSTQVMVSGEMRRVMRQGQLSAVVCMDTLLNRTGIYGLGPLEQLKGEILVVDGVSYVSTIDLAGEERVVVMREACAPFFVHAYVSGWTAVEMPDSVRTDRDLERYLEWLGRKGPFVFRLVGEMERISYHIQNLPAGTVVRSMADAHTGQRQFHPNNVVGEVVGFFSTEHQTVFTHHDSYVHMHFISADRRRMGHVDRFRVDPSKVKLYISK